MPDPPRAPIVQEIFRRYAAGESRRGIIADLRRRRVGLRIVGKGGVNQLTRMLTNPAYIGQRVHRGQVVGRGDWEPLIDAAMWARVQTRLGRASAREARGYRHLLSGIARCGRPEGAVRAASGWLRR